jgi:hypothetical protein
MSRRCMLTTVDNPHSPFDDFPAWYAFDVSSGYHSSSFLARILVDSDQLSEENLAHALENAIDEVVRENVSGVYRKVVQEVDD